MNTMMFNLALPSVAHDFGLSAASTSWIVTGYSIIFAISSITYSRLSDFVPIRRLIVIALVSLSAAAIVGLFSDSFLLLLLVRLVQASGAGAIPALSLVLITRYVPLERRGKAMAIIMSAASLGLGQVLSWRGHRRIYRLALSIRGHRRYDCSRSYVRDASSVGETNQRLLRRARGILRRHRDDRTFVVPYQSIRDRTGCRFNLTRSIRDTHSQGAGSLRAAVLFLNRPYLMLGAVGIAAYLCSFATLFLIPQILVNLYGLSAISSGLIIFPGSLLALFLSRKVGKIIDLQGNAAIIRYIPLLVLASVLLFALFAGSSYIAILFIYMLLSIGFTFLTSSISNEMSRILQPSQFGSGLGLFQLLQFFSGAFGVAATASALTWQKDLPLQTAYSNIYWGLTVVVLVSIGCAYLYGRRTLRMAENR